MELPLPVPNLTSPISRIRTIGQTYPVSQTSQTARPLIDTTLKVIGHSREGRPLHAAVFGTGPRNVSIIAGCHADEPVGPMTAHALPKLLTDHFPDLLTRFRFHVVPQMNPDGAGRNRSWFRDPLSFPEHAANAVREEPGDDIEFGFGKGDDTRPECLAAMNFLQRHAPYRAHFSLHGMGFSEGAWFLICREWVERSGPLLDGLQRVAAAAPFPLHDIDRQGEKGFTRIRPGFCTTPTSLAMRDHFLQNDDAETAARFKPSSMEFAQSLASDPLCMVSEMPLFRIGLRDDSGPGAAYLRFKDELESLREQTTTPDPTSLLALAHRYSLTPVPLELQVRLQVAMVVLALENILPA